MSPVGSSRIEMYFGSKGVFANIVKKPYAGKNGRDKTGEIQKAGGIFPPAEMNGLFDRFTAWSNPKYDILY